MKKFVFTFAVLAFSAIAGAAEKHVITLYQPSVIGGQELKPGEYRIELTGNKLVVRDGKRVIEADVKLESQAKKFDTTSVRYLQDKQVSEIRIGGARTKVLLGSGGSNAN